MAVLLCSNTVCDKFYELIYWSHTFVGGDSGKLFQLPMVDQELHVHGQINKVVQYVDDWMAAAWSGLNQDY